MNVKFRDSGAVLMFVLIISVVLVIMALYFFEIFGHEMSLFKKRKAFYMAEAGIERASGWITYICPEQFNEDRGIAAGAPIYFNDPQLGSAWNDININGTSIQGRYCVTVDPADTNSSPGSPIPVTRWYVITSSGTTNNVSPYYNLAVLKLTVSVEENTTGFYVVDENWEKIK